MITILALAVVWFVIAKSISATAVSTVFTSLTLMLYLLVPWTATNLVDFFFVRRGHYAITDLFDAARDLRRLGPARPDRLLRRLRGRDPVHGPARPRRLAYTGLLAKALDGVDIAWIVGLIVSGGVYWVLSRSLDVEREKEAEVSSRRELVAVS